MPKLFSSCFNDFSDIFCVQIYFILGHTQSNICKLLHIAGKSADSALWQTKIKSFTYLLKYVFQITSNRSAFFTM